MSSSTSRAGQKSPCHQPDWPCLIPLLCPRGWRGQGLGTLWWPREGHWICLPAGPSSWPRRSTGRGRETLPGDDGELAWSEKRGHLGVPAAMGERTRAPLWKTQVAMRAEWKAKPVSHFCTASRAQVVSICAAGVSDRTRSWPRWPEHTRAPFDVQPWTLRAHLPLPGGCCFRGLPWSPPEVPELPGSPPRPSYLNSAQLPTQGPHFAPTTRGHYGRGLFPPKTPPARSDQEPA